MTDVRTGSSPAATQESRRNLHGDFIWYELITPDPDGAKAFYEAVMGWEVGPASPEHNGYREIRSGDGHTGGMLPLTDEMRQHGARPAWLGYIGVDDVDRAVESIERGGGKELMPAWDIPGIGRIAMVADPQGVPFYVMRGAVDEVSTAFSLETPGRCGWNELATSDPVAAIDFYTSRFGWEKGEAMPMGDMGNYQILNHAGRHLGAIMRAGPGMPSRWRFYFRVDDVDDAKAKVESGGGTVVHGPQEVPGGERILIGTDPQGAEFALVGK
jgi:predicted enzyme related to lactoylglutathione lyase